MSKYINKAGLAKIDVGSGRLEVGRRLQGDGSLSPSSVTFKIYTLLSGLDFS